MSEEWIEGSNPGQHIRCTLISTDGSRVQPSPEVFLRERQTNLCAKCYTHTVCSFKGTLKDKKISYIFLFVKGSHEKIKWFYNKSSSWHCQTNSQMSICVEPLSSFLISKGRRPTCLWTQLDRPTTNQFRDLGALCRSGPTTKCVTFQIWTGEAPLSLVVSNLLHIR